MKTEKDGEASRWVGRFLSWPATGLVPPWLSGTHGPSVTAPYLLWMDGFIDNPLTQAPHSYSQDFGP